MTETGDLRGDRKDYNKDELHRETLQSSPLNMFNHWMSEARAANIIDATAMTLATVGDKGAPSARIVLLKQFNDSGFYWYTNYDSRKGAELRKNPAAALVFYWRELERQVRIEGMVSKASTEDSDTYFNQRPAESRLSAAASPQSQIIKDQQWLTERTNALRDEHKNKTLDRPDNWGGYRLKPHCFEFWQGRPSRQHDRFRYTRTDSDAWQIDRLAP